MENYTEKNCPVCNEPIAEDDAAKICPACGIPHHEKCWEENHGCTTPDCSENPNCVTPDQTADVCEDDAASVDAADDAQESIPEKHFCTNCGTELAEGQNFCPTCGQKVGLAADPKSAGKNKKLFVILGAAAAAVVIIILVLVLCLGGGSKKNFRDMYGDIASKAWCTIPSDGSYLKLDTNPYDTDDDDFDWTYYQTYYTPASDAIKRINKELGFSDALMEKMNTTTWSQGRQTDSNEKYSVTWTYHPDKGLEVMYEFKK